MGRRKIEIRAIKDDRNRSVTFLKRKGGLFKKAHELSVLCSVDVAVIIFGHNKKLYEFSSGDINETLRRYQYYGPPHEHKGPSDFKNKGGGDDDDDDEDDGDDGSQKREDSLPPPQVGLMPPHMHHNSFQHVRQPAASASPPMPNGMFQARHSTPQPPGMISRSNSRGEIRRPTSTIVPMQQASQQPPPQNGYAYMPNPPIYNPHAGVQAGVPPPQPSPQPQYHQFQPQPTPPQPQQSHQQIQQAHQVFLAQQQQQQQQHQRRESQPPPPVSNSLAPPPQPAPRSSPQPDHPIRPPSPPDRRHKSNSQSIFTPIDEGGSVLARVFFGGPDPPRRDEKKDSSPEIKPPPRAASQPSTLLNRSESSQPARATTTASVSREFPTPKRSDTSGSRGASRPKLNLQIPSEAEENDSRTGSPRNASGSRSANPERSHNGMILPPPSPSASALLSAGASGPPNPFARPPPPTSQQNSNAYSENRNNTSNTLETPMSALPSRYMEQSLIASPGGLFSDWDNWGRGGLNSAVLPSPLTFPTPSDAKPPVLFGGKGEGGNEEKRKAEDSASGETKRVKT